MTTTPKTVLLCSLFALLTACSGGAVDVTTTTTTVPPDPTTTVAPDPAIDGPVFRVGLIGDITSANWWAAMDTAASSENRAIQADTKESMFEVSVPGFALVSSLAVDPEPQPPHREGSVWVVEQTIRDDASWSDGQPVTAGDLAFYFDTVRALDLGSTHGAHFPESVTSVEAVDDLTVRVVFASEPTLSDWQAGVALAPFVPAHFWQPYVSDALEAATEARRQTTDSEAVEALIAPSLEDDDPLNDLSAEDISAEDVDAYKDRVAAAAGRDALYGLDITSEPSCGPMILEDWRPGEMARSRSNPGFFGRGTETTAYDDGSVRVAAPGVGDVVYGGDASGAIVAYHVVGPFVSGVEWQEMGGEEEAYAALAEGRIDFVYDPDGMKPDTYQELARDEDVDVSISEGEGFRFLAFNLRKPPMSDPVFRYAVATVIAKEEVISSLFAGSLFPAYTIVNPALTGFAGSDVSRPGWSTDGPMDEGGRISTAVDVLAAAGYSWSTEPETRYDDRGRFVDVIPGEGLTMPNGQQVPELTIVTAPGSADDPLRVTFALWIAEWLRDLGIEARVDATDFDTVIETVIAPTSSEAALSWDLHVLGWGRPDVALPGLTLVALFHSRNGVEFGGLNTTGYSSPEFDSAAGAFLAAKTMEEADHWTREMERIIATDLPYVTLYRDPVIEAFGAGVIFPVGEIMGGHASTANGWPESVRLTD